MSHDFPRGRGSDRGSSRGGRGGRGGARGGGERGGGRGRGRGRGGYVANEVEQEAALVMAQLGIPYGGNGASPRGGRGTPRGTRGQPGYPRGGRGFFQPFTPPNGRGRGRGTGLGFRRPPELDAQWGGRGGFGGGGMGGGRGRERPLLKPVIFVKSGLLFQHEEDIFAAEVVDEEEDPAQTADWLERTFERAAVVAAASEHLEEDTPPNNSSDEDAADALEVDLIAGAEISEMAMGPSDQGIVHASHTEISIAVTMADGHPAQRSPPLGILAERGLETDDEEEQIVFVPLMSRSRTASKAPSPVPPLEEPTTANLIPDELPSVSGSAVPERVVETMLPVEVAEQPSVSPSEQPITAPASASSSPVPPAFPSEPTFASFSFSAKFRPSPRAKRLSKKEAKRQRRAAKRKRQGNVTLHMGSGIMPRVGDSDIEWGDDGPPGGSEAMDVDGSSSEGDGVEERLSGAMGEMDMDDVDAAAMKRFLKGLSAPEVTIGDLDDENRMKAEDEEDGEGGENGGTGDWTTDDESGSDDELDAAVKKEEEELVGESSDDEESEEENVPSAAGPSSGLKARLQRTEAANGAAKNKKKGKWRMNYDEEDESDDEKAMFEGNLTWADRDEEFIAGIQDILDDNADILQGRDRRENKKIFTAIRDGDFGDLIDSDDMLYANSNVKGKKKKRAGLPAELQVQWDKDRAKKADYKRARALARKQAELDPFRPAKGKNKNKKGGKKGKSNPDESSTSETDSEFAEPFEPITDLLSLERMIRVFLRDLGKTTMVLPSMDKESRRRVHMLSECFSLKSKSKGSGEARFPILLKTTRSGIGIDERKVERILEAAREVGANSGAGAFFKAYSRARGTGGGGGGGGKMGGARHREGDIVGGKAEKIGESNIGYKLLQQMGWAEGDRIGKTGGLADPLTAKIKMSKLGLGAQLR